MLQTDQTTQKQSAREHYIGWIVACLIHRPMDFVKTLEQLKATFRFGKWKTLSEGSEFNGRHLKQ
eukprot:4073620-Amphidinium_carterae.1